MAYSIMIKQDFNDTDPVNLRKISRLQPITHRSHLVLLTNVNIQLQVVRMAYYGNDYSAVLTASSSHPFSSSKRYMCMLEIFYIYQ